MSHEMLSSISDIVISDQDSSTIEISDTKENFNSLVRLVDKPVMVIRYFPEEQLEIIETNCQVLEILEVSNFLEVKTIICQNLALIEVISRVSRSGNKEHIRLLLNNKEVIAKITKLQRDEYILIDLEEKTVEIRDPMFDNYILNHFDGIIVIDTLGKIVKFNTSAEKMFGYSRYEAQGNNIKILIPSPFAERHDSYLAKYNQSRRKNVIGTVREVKAKRKTGEIFLAELYINEFYIDSKKYFVGIIRDYSIIKKYSSLDDTVERYIRHTVFNRLPIGLIVLRKIENDSDYRIILVNNKFITTFNLQHNDILEKSISKVIPALNKNEIIHAAIIKTLKNNEIQIVENSNILKTNQAINLTIFQIDQETVGIILNDSVNISKPSISAEIELQRNRKENAIFLSNIGHEIRTNLNSIFGNIDLIKATENITSDQEKYLENTVECTNDLANIIEDILIYSQIETEEFKMEFKSFSVQKLIEDCLDQIRKRTVEKNIKTLFSIGKKVPEYIITDYDKLKRILENIYSNAIKYTDTGKIVTHVEIRANKMVLRESRPTNVRVRKNTILNKLALRRNQSSQTDETSDDSYSESDQCKYVLVISITDTGVGIPKSMHEDIFKPFVKVKEKHQMYGGTGLGLYICRWYAEKMGGRVWVDSEIHVGSTFNIEIPVNEDTNLKRIRKIATNVDFTGLNILLVDPNITDRVEISKILMGWNFSTFMCEDESEIQKYLENQSLKFSIILIDTTLLNKLRDNIRLYEKIKKENLNIICVENGEDGELSDRKSSIGIDQDDDSVYATFQKPIEKSRLYASLVQLLIDQKKSISINIKSKLKILVIDDNRQNSALIKNLLEQIGYTNIQMMPNGFELVDKLKAVVPTNMDYDVILMDFYLPKWTGDVLTTMIKKKIKDPLKCPHIIGMTASTSADVKKKGFQAGMDAFLWKPLDRKELESLLEIIMRKKKIQ
jgi:PAS domain S-box-containing protein